MNAQAAATTAIGKNLVGRKIALTPIGSAIAAAILDAQTVDSAASAEVGKVGAKAIEVEICFVLNRDLPQPQSGKPYTREDALNAIGSIHLGVELISFRIDRKNEVPLSLFLADRLGNHSYVIGPEISDDIVNRLASGDTSTLSLRVDDGGNNKFSGIPGHPQVDPLLPLIAYMNNPCDRLGGLRRGQFATTGSLCGVIPVQPGSSLDISGTMLPEMKLTFCDRYHAKSHVT